MRFFRRRPPPPDRAEADAIDWLREDHEQTEELFAAYAQMVRQAAPDGTRQRLAAWICTTLTICDTLETELFYPAARAALADPAAVDSALDDHVQLRTLVSEVRAAQPAQADYDERVARVGRWLHDHVRFEEGVLFVALRRRGATLDGLALALAQRRRQLLVALEARP